MKTKELSAKWIGLITDQEIGKGTKQMETGAPAPYFRKEFTVTSEVKKATLVMSALGLYQGYINGIQTDEELFKPQWTDYNKTIEAREFDVTKLILPGKNCVGAILGEGWYSGKISIIGRQLYGGYPLSLFLELNIELSNGTKIVVKSDESFKASTGKIRDNDFQNGETWDNRIKSEEYFIADYDDFAWEKVSVMPSCTSKLHFTDTPVIKYHEEFPAKFLHSFDSKLIYDIGQNMSGNIQACFKGKCGDKIVIRYGEMLNNDGSLYTDNLRSAKCTDTFICRGEGSEIFQPMFTFHGFRYIEISATLGVEIVSLKAFACYSDLCETGSFSCDNALVEKIFKNSFWGQKSNFVGLPTDCPQRDERMGWTGDSYAFCGSAMYNMDCRNFYRKYMDDLVEAIRCEGAVTDVVPYVPVVGSGNNGWGDVIGELTYTYYCMYGDLDFVKRYLPHIKRWVDYLVENSDNLIRLEIGYGDWLSIIQGETNVSAINTAHTAHSAWLTSRMCELCGDSDASKYESLFENIKSRYRETFVSESGVVAGGTQGDYLSAIAFGLVDPKECGEYLRSTMKKCGDHLSCGFMTIKYLLPVLCDLGYVDLAYKLIGQDTYPSWGYSVRQGATTIWEHWDSYTEEKGFCNPEMNSFNHYSFGSCSEWYYRYILGIRNSEKLAGFSCANLCPCVDFSGVLNAACGSYNSINGKISVEWSVEKGVCTYKATSSGVKLTLDLNSYKIIKQTVSDSCVYAEFAKA